MIWALTAALIAIRGANSFYLPGVAPHNYNGGESVDLKVNKLRYPICFAKDFREEDYS
jgi:hypothetical protein